MIYDATDRGSVEVPMMYVDDIDTSADAAPSVPEIETSVTDPSVWGLLYSEFGSVLRQRHFTPYSFR